MYMEDLSLASFSVGNVEPFGSVTYVSKSVGQCRKWAHSVNRCSTSFGFLECI
jgi:hypothetical protein